MYSPEQNEPSERKEPLTIERLIAIGLVVKINSVPKNIQLTLESLDQYEIPTGESSESLEIQKLYGNVVATGESRWEDMTGIKYADRKPLTEAEKEDFYAKKSQ